MRAVAWKLATVFFGDFMLNIIGIIGYGFVGKACHKAFEHNSLPLIIDPKFDTGFTIRNLSERSVRITFVCVPAPTLQDGAVDTSIVCTILDALVSAKYKGIVVIKSTIPPHDIDEIYKKYASDRSIKKDGPLNLVYSPEFLREGHWEYDALNPSMIILGGDFLLCTEVKNIYECHSHIKMTKFIITSMVEASLVKYTINTFLATKTTFFNQIYRYYIELNEGKEPHYELWNAFTEMVGTDHRMGNSHMKVPGPDGRYGYGGTCFPKDVKAFIGSDKNGHLSILREVELANTKIRLTGKAEDSNNN